MRILANRKIMIGNLTIPRNEIVDVPDSVKNDGYFNLCLQSDYLQILEEKSAKSKKKSAKSKEE